MLDVRGLPELKAAALLMKNADAATRAAIRKESAAWAPELRRAITANAPDAMSKRIAATAKVTANAKGLKAVVGSTGRLPSGDPIREVARPWEFGGNRNVVAKYLGRSPKGKAVIYKRHVQRQIPNAVRTGRFVYPAVAEMTPKLVSNYIRAMARAVTPK